MSEARASASAAVGPASRRSRSPRSSAISRSASAGELTSGRLGQGFLSVTRTLPRLVEEEDLGVAIC
jgi:hypothetical protein